ncbi:MAG: hypothetical protein GAK44_00242 [Pseudomonas delhiensis]|nr:MAG: hypothetical protein GAK44_00242 [Pseudomonas delhiensis]
MRVPLFLLLLYPLVELAVLIKVGSVIGVGLTLLLLIAGAVIGAALLRVAGITTALRARERLSRGELPEKEVFEGLMIAVGGLLLMLPGFISDVIALFCLLPFTRRLVLGGVSRRMQEQAERARAFADDPNAQRSNGPSVIEGEYERREEQRDRLR